MAKENNNNYKPLKNPERIGGRETRSANEIVADGKQGKKGNEKFTEMLKRQEEQSKKGSKVNAIIEQRKKELEKVKAQDKTHEPNKDR